MAARNFDIALVIRAWNEAADLDVLLTAIKHQQYSLGKIELVVVDNGSVDETGAVARRHGAKVIFLPQEEFNYPRSSNLGISATTTPFVGLVSAHSVPIGNEWLNCIPFAFFHPTPQNICVAGIYGHTLPLRRDWIKEWWGIRNFWRYKMSTHKGTRLIPMVMPGVLGATNCVIRRNLWEEHPFDETYGAGGEDLAWAHYAFNKGMQIILEPRFSVYHSHGVGFFDRAKQKQYWASLESPRPFNQNDLLKYRHDLRH
jgi:glycosyltransferase involved in cell wall biosynthesis